MARTKKELLELLTTANKKLEEFYTQDQSVTASLDHVLSSLEQEYEDRIALQDKIVKLEAELAVSGEEHRQILAQLRQMQAAMTISLDRLDSIRSQVEATKVSFAKNQMELKDMDIRLDEIAKTADVTIISIDQFKRPFYQH
ncbi:MAG: hypothetical protein HQ503_09710 [Rhodospirillales bacterium]|nr:hypothetical protein [Rhodospirillales bacterium]